MPLQLPPPAAASDAPAQVASATPSPAPSRQGHAKLACRVNTDGTLSECRVLDESPKGLGFGAASLRMSRMLRVKPAIRDGKPLAGSIVFPMTWKIEDGPAPPPAPPR